MRGRYLLTMYLIKRINRFSLWLLAHITKNYIDLFGVYSKCSMLREIRIALLKDLMQRVRETSKCVASFGGKYSCGLIK